jgi:uncharacterized protein with PIN domain
LSSDEARPKFIVDANVGKLARWLRMLGYDTIFVNDIDDGVLVDIGLKEERVLLTRDTQIMRRRPIASGKVRALLTMDDDPKKQMRQVITEMKLDREREFTLCLECNVPLAPMSKDEVCDLVPPYVYKTQTQYHQCPVCGRIYWRGTHWEHMNRELERLMETEV